MSFSSSYLEKRKKRLKEREKQLDNKFNNDIAPVGGNKDSWFKGGALSDGYEFGDITKTILGTAGDAGIGIVKGAGRMVEGIADVATYGVAGVADLFGADSFAKDARDVAKFSATDEFTAPVTNYVDRFSLLGNKGDAVTEGIGQVGTILLTGGAGGAAGLGTGGVTALTTGVTGLSSMGSGMSQAYTEGATDKEALTYGLIAGVAEAGTELLFGGLGKAVGAVGLSKGISSLDDALAKKVSSKIANQTMKNFAEFGIKAGAEGTEEVISGILQAFGKKATYMSEEELGKLLKDENLLDSFIVGTITSGITQSGVVPGMKRGSLIEANKQGADFITGHTETEQKVIDKVTESSVTEREKELGRKLNAKERAEIEEDVETKLIKGGISIDTIEETLGGDSYKAYKEATEKQEALKKELNELRNMKKGEMTDIQTDRLTELKAMDLEDTSKVDELKAKASQDVFELIKADRKGQGSILAESYNERERRGVAFEVDTNKVDSKKADTYKRAMEAGVLNNTNATHDFVDLVATLESEKGIKIDFSNNEKLKASGFAVDGAEVNGVKTNGGIILNANSRKNLNVVVGHEITHILEGTELYTALRDTIISYAKSKGDYDARYKATSKLYEKVNDTDIDGEITADLVGEYLFTDEKFIKSLTANKNLFQKVYDEIKYLVKVATAGSTEKKQLLKVQRAFEKAFESNKETDADHEAMGKKHLKNKDVLYNLSAVESHKSNLEKQYSNDATISLETLTERYDKVIDIWKKLGGELNSKFLNEWNNKVGKDRAFTVFKAQAGYKYNVELSSMCKKGVPLFEAIDTIVKEEVMKELDTEVIGKEEKEILYDILKTNNFEIPCAICYVEQARQREGVIIDAFLNGKIEKNNAGKTTTFKLGWNEVLKAVEREMKTNGVDYTFHAVDRSIATDKYVPADISMDEDTQDAFYKALKKVANKEITRYNKAENKNRKLVTSITPAAIKEVFKGTLPSNLKIFKVLFTEPSSRFTMESDLLYSSMTTHNLVTAHNNLYSLFNSQGGVSGYKTKQGTVVYWGDILGKTWVPSKVRNEGGIRNQSNSDFQMYTLLDQVQMYVDFSAKGYYLQAYTKVLAELKLFGLSRGKINASLIPAVYVYHNSDGSIDTETTRAYAGLDKNGNLLFDDIEGINHTEAFMLLEDAEYSKSIGGICIGYSDRHIRKLLDDKRVQQIIGFHDKTDDPDKRYRGAKYAKNYNGENEAVNNEDGKTVHIGFNPYVRKAEKMFTFDAKTETYNGEIEYNGKTYVADDIPKLAADLYLEMCKKKNYTPAYNIFSDHENYYKLLADFSLYDSQGHYAPHRKVSFNMPDSVPYLDNNGKKKYMPAKDYIKAELEKELKVRDSISEALADKSETGLIPQFVKRVNESKAKQRDNQYSLSEMSISDRDSAYMDAYFDGDDDLMQQLVDEAAKEAGYKYKAYHHTENAFTEFDLRRARTSMDIQGFYFSADPDAEREYGTVRYDTYLKMENPYIVDSKEAQKAIPFDMSKGNAGITARKWLQDNGYDGVIRKAEYFGAEADEYIVFDSSQIKSSEPMTFSDDEYGEGDVIPLSERFNSSNNDIRYSLSEIVAEDGTSYGIGVKLDSTLLDNLEPKDRISLIKEYVRELQGKVFTAFDEDGEPVDISIAEGNKRFRNSKGNRVATNKDLTTKHISKETKQEAIALIDELISTASYQGSEAARHPHDWLDNDGKNDWDKWTTYIQDKNNTIWEATLHIANTTNGEKILYDISLIKKAEQSGKSDTSLLTLGQSGESDTIPDDNSIAPLPGNVKRDAKFSLSDTEDIAPVDNIVDNVDIAPIANKYSDIEEQIKANEEQLESLMAEYEKISNMVDNGEMSVADFDFRAEDITKEYDDTKRRIDALTYELTEIEKNNVTVTDAIKNYSKKDALVVVERMGVNDLTKAARKKLADDLWEGMNKNTTVEQREAFAREFAKTATDTIVKKSRKENPDYNSAKEQLPYIASGIGRLTFTADDMAELRYKYDKDLKKFLGRWGYKGGTNADGTPKRRYPMSQFVIDYARETAGMSHLEDMHHAEAMIEINELYEDLSAEVKNRWVNSYEEATKEEIESLKADIERTVLEAFETEGRDARVKKGLEAAYDKIDKQFEADKASLDKAFEKSKENALATLNEKDRSAYIAHLEERYAMRLAELTEQVKREKELAKKESERVRRKDLHNSIIEAIKAEYTKRGLDFDEVLDKGKRKGNFASVDNTPQRFIEKTLGYKEGQILNDLTVNKIALNESAGIKWLNGQVDNIRKLSEKYNIKPGSKESAAAQMYGEGFYVNKEGEYVKYGDAELAKDFPSIEVQNNIKALAKNSEVRRMYDETLDAINASRVRNGYPEIPKRADYFLHFRAMDDTFSRLGIPFNPNDIKAKDLPTDINGMTANLKPGQPYFASANKRMGIRTTYDLLGGIERYMNSAKNQIYHIDDIQTLRAVRNYVADRYGQANGLNDLDSMTPDEQEARIKDVYDGHLSTFAKFLNEEANIIAGKTSLMDRSVEGIFGRRAMQVLNTINSQVGKNMVGFSISSAGTNFLPLVQAAAKLRKSDMIKAFSQTISNKFNSDGFVENDPVLIRRKGADKFAKTAWEKASDIGYVLMSAVDNLASEVIVRAKYNELTRNGLDNEQAHIKAGEWASRLMGDRSLGQMPQLFNSKTLGIFTKFQLEVRNQLDSMFYDSFQEAKESTENIQDAKERIAKTASKVASTLAQLFVFQHIFGMVYEQIAGYNPTFDILSTLATLFGWDDEEESEDTFGDNLQQAFNELLEDLPYTSTFTGGRIPMSAALPVEELLTGKDEWGNEVSRLETIGEIAPYYILPTGYGQLKKTISGLGMFSDEHPIAGSYTDSGNLRFPVEETPLNIAQAAVFGQYANKNAREYFDNEYAPLTPNQVEEFMATGMSYSEYSKKKKAKKIKEAKAKELIYSIVGGEDLYQEYTDALSEIKAGVYVDRKTRVLGYLNSLDIDYVTKLILYKKQFPNDNRFNVALVNYLNERDDISYSEMETILTELGFQVDEDGNIKW